MRRRRYRGVRGRPALEPLPLTMSSPRRLARLTRPTDIRAVFAARGARHGSTLVLHTRRREDEGVPRATVVAGRKLGGAVRRNRARRRLRAALTAVVLPGGTDLVVVARPPVLDAPWPRLTAELQALVQGGAA